MSTVIKKIVYQRLPENVRNISEGRYPKHSKEAKEISKFSGGTGKKPSVLFDIL